MAEKKSDKPMKKLSKLSPKKKTGPLNVVEQVPNWLRMLLGKYGEAQGQLVGLQESSEPFEPELAAPIPPAVPFTDVDDDPESAELSALLQQMAQDGAPEGARAQGPTSVEWGPAAEAVPQPEAELPATDLPATDELDDANFDEIPDWLNDTITTPDYDSAAELPDGPEWLSEPESAADTAAETTEDAAADYPDWLTSAINATAPAAAAMGDTVGATAGDDEIADWLNDAQSVEEQAPEWLTAPPEDVLSAEQDVEIPDWLSDMAPPSTTGEPADAPEAPPVAPQPDTELADDEIPPWITAGIVEPPAAEAAPPTEAAFTSLPPDMADDEIPDWLTGEPADQPTEAPAQPAADMEIPDWLDQPVDAPPETETTPQDDDMAWLAGLATAPDQAASAPSEPAVQDEIPDWLSDMEVASADEPVEEIAAPTVGKPEPDDWLAGLRAAVPEESPTSEEDTSGWTAEDETEIEIPDWLAETENQAVPTEDVPAGEESGDTTVDMPDWLAEPPEIDDIPPVPTAEESLSLDEPELTAGSDVTTADESPELPDWLTELSDEEPDSGLTTGSVVAAAGAAAAATLLPQIGDEDGDETAGTKPAADIESPAAEADEDLPDWLADLPKAPVTAELSPFEVEDTAEIADTTEEDDSPPDWLADLPKAPLTGMLDLDETDLLADSDQPQAEEPDSGLTTGSVVAAAGAAAAATLLPQPGDEDGDETAGIEPAADDTPGWLADMSPVDAEPAVPTSDLPETEGDTPGWLTDMSEAPPIEDMSDWSIEDLEPAGSIIEETPDWLADLPELDEEVDAGQDTGSVADEVPPWLADLPKAPVTAELSPFEVEDTTEAEEAANETPDWLADLPKAPVTAELSPFEVEDTAEAEEAGDDAPDWLAGLRPSAPPAEDTPEDDSPPEWLMDTPQDGIDTPDWLVDPAETAADQAAADTAASAASVAATLHHLADEPSAGADSDELAEAPDEELPDWLADLPKAPLTGPLTEPGESGESVPDWMADLPKAPLTGPLDMIEEEPPEAEVDLSGDIASLFGPEEPGIETEDDDSGPDAGVALAAAAGVVGAAAAVPGSVPFEAEDTTSDEDDDTPDWLADLSLTDVEPTADIEQSAADTGEELPDWLDNIRQSATAKVETPAETAADTDVEIPDWLDDLPDTDSEESQETGDDDIELPAWFNDSPEADATEDSTETATKIEPGDDSEEDDLVIPDWLGQTTLEDLETPDWLDDDDIDADLLPETPPPEPDDGGGGAGLPDFTQSDDAPELPDWMQEDDDESSKKSEGGFSLEAPAAAVAVPAEDSPITSSDTYAKETTDQPASGSSAATAAALGAAGAMAAGAVGATAAGAASSAGAATGSKMQGWMDALQSGNQPTRPVESAGSLPGISTLLSSQTTSSTAPTGRSTDSVAEAAQTFYTIATAPPQPASLPKPLSTPEKLAGRAVRAGLYLLFILLIALPLLPGLQRQLNGQTVAWTEPDREFSDVLDSQRRQLISQQLGIIDLQPPDSVALVSFDYSTATQGEMQPLAEAVLGRLSGQGMRIIGISLEPEGAPIAQHTLEKLLAEKGQEYGDRAVNLGYLPGQAVAVRELATGQKLLAALPDYRDQLTFGDAGREGWQDVGTLEQVSVIVTLADSPVTGRWWVEQTEQAVAPDSGQRFLLAGASAAAEPFLTPYRENEQLDGLIAGINGAAAIEAGRRTFGPARQMIDSLSMAHLLIVILIAAGTIVGWMPKEALLSAPESPENKRSPIPAPDEEEVD